MSRSGGTILRLLVMAAIAGIAGAMAWGMLNFHRVTGQWQFHPLDSKWWNPTATKNEQRADVFDHARVFTEQVGQALWGSGGLVERVEQWWQRESGHTTAGSTATATPGASPSTTPTTPSPTPESTQPLAPANTVRGMLELRIVEADKRFRAGMGELKSASPATGDSAASTTERLSHVLAAREHFVVVAKDLDEVIPAYEALPSHDVRRAATARQLREFNAQMLSLTGGS